MFFNLLVSFDSVMFEFVTWHANKVAHDLAKLGKNSDSDLSLITPTCYMSRFCMTVWMLISKSWCGIFKQKVLKEYNSLCLSVSGWNHLIRPCYKSFGSKTCQSSRTGPSWNTFVGARAWK